MRRVRFAPEGWLFIIPVVILAAAALLLQWYSAAIVLSALAAFLLNFFRDPHRLGSEHHVDVLSPADGTVVQIRDIPDGDVWPGLTKQISIFMSVFDVHVNRAPISGKIVHYRYNPGKKIAAMSHKSSEENEQNLIRVGMLMNMGFAAPRPRPENGDKAVRRLRHIGAPAQVITFFQRLINIEYLHLIGHCCSLIHRYSPFFCVYR